MEIISYIDLFLGAMINSIFYYILIRKIFNVKEKTKKHEVLLIIVIVSFLISVINFYNKNIFKAVLTIPIIVFGTNKIFKIEVGKSIYYTLIASFYLLIGEMIAFALISLLYNIIEIKYINWFGAIIGNIIVIIFTTPLLLIESLKQIINSFSYIRIDKKAILIIFIVFLMISSAFTFNISINLKDVASSVMNFIIFLTFLALLYTSYNEKQRIDEISEEYNCLLKYLDKYEKEVTEKRKLIHDFKNELIVINGYAEGNDKLKEYLNGIIEEQKSIKETKIVKNIDKLPNGLKGLMYYKLSQIENNINIVLSVKSKFKSFEKLTPKDNKNLLKIIGILIDNAIESSIKSSDKYILIEVSMSKGIFNISIINTYSGKINKNEIMKQGFSTKGKNRGYGLSLVDDIIKSDKRYNLLCDISDNEVEMNLTFSIK